MSAKERMAFMAYDESLSCIASKVDGLQIHSAILTHLRTVYVKSLLNVSFIDSQNRGVTVQQIHLTPQKICSFKLINIYYYLNEYIQVLI